MAEKHTFCLLLEIRTEDRRLTDEAIEAAIKTADGVKALRRAVLQHLPRDVSRVIAMFPVEHAKMLLQLHEAFGDDIAKHLREQGIDVGGLSVYPPPDYVPPE
ncbi:MAG TPA: hypothetical protein VL614_00635 [Acetobacteraceae bacterium]|jgi:hypothetical protein|nr:hypothetical protein [Acetobacteraceae bacterium]